MEIFRNETQMIHVEDDKAESQRKPESVDAVAYELVGVVDSDLNFADGWREMKIESKMS
jgi:hypothetical protein